MTSHLLVCLHLGTVKQDILFIHDLLHPATVKQDILFTHDLLHLETVKQDILSTHDLVHLWPVKQDSFLSHDLLYHDIHVYLFVCYSCVPPTFSSKLNKEVLCLTEHSVFFWRLHKCVLHLPTTTSKLYTGTLPDGLPVYGLSQTWATLWHKGSPPTILSRALNSRSNRKQTGVKCTNAHFT